MLRKLIERWNSWIGDSDLERAIRDHLVCEGYPRKASEIREARMVAIQRPGWVQVWKFRVETVLDDQPLTLFGAARDDGRTGTRVVVSQHFSPVQLQLSQWSEGLIRRR